MEPRDVMVHGDGRQSALVVLVPEAEDVVGAWRQRLDPAAALGIPAHLTVLFPFVDPPDVDDEVRDTLTEILSGMDAFDFVLDRIGWFGDDVVWLGPNPAAPFTQLTERIVEHWPAHQPYGGVFEEVVPHLTIGDGGDLEVMRRAADDVEAHLPIRARASEVHLIVGSEKPGSWTTSEAFALRATR